MTTLREGHLRVLYSLLKPAVRCAARFHVPIRTVVELLRLAYFEVLQQEGLSFADIGNRMGQTDRHMRSLAQKLKTDFFAAEVEVGLVREIESMVALKPLSRDAVAKALSVFDKQDVERAIAVLLSEDRIRMGDDGQLRVSGRYTVVGTEQFHRRVDALNHCMEALYGAIVHRLLLDDSATAMVKTMSFVASPEALRKFTKKLEGELRTELAALEESALYGGTDEARFILNLALTPVDAK